MVAKITAKASLKLSYNGKAVINGDMLTPSETQVTTAPRLATSFYLLHSLEELSLARRLQLRMPTRRVYAGVSQDS